MRAALRRFLADPVASWRGGTPASQAFVLAILMVLVLLSGVVTWFSYNVMPLTTYYVWLLISMMVLRFRPLLVLSGWVLVVVAVGVVHGPDPTSTIRISACTVFVLCVALILYASSRQRSGLPGPVGEAMLADLRDRLQQQSRVPPLPAGWHSQSAMIAASGVGYGGDFMVVAYDEDRANLEMILVDVCGKGVGAATQALQFAGALDGLIGALPPAGLFEAANDFLLRQDSDETFATAAHVLIDLRTGAYRITSAGHPPALVYEPGRAAWDLDGARGTALGIMPRPELHTTTGALQPGQALMFYTDGVIERPGIAIDEGVAWLQRTAGSAVDAAAGRGFEGAARRIIRRVQRGDDDRAVLMLWRDGVGPVVEGPGDEQVVVGR